MNVYLNLLDKIFSTVLISKCFNWRLNQLNSDFLANNLNENSYANNIINL